jgi:hypothetical protein
MGGIDLGLSLYADVLKDRHQLLGEAVERVLGFPHIHDAKAFLSLPWDVSEQALDRPVGRRFHTALAAGEPTYRFLVLLLRHTLVNEHDWHRYLLASGTAGAYGLVSSRAA